MKTDAAEKAIGKDICILSNKIKREIDRIFSDSELTGVQAKIMHYIMRSYESHDVFQRDIEEKFCLRRSTATGILNLIEKAGVIVREPVDYDARLKKIVPTEKAIEIRQRLDERINIIEEKLVSGVSKRDTDIFLSVIRKMSDNLD